METNRGINAPKAGLLALLPGWFSAGSPTTVYCCHMPSLRAFGDDLTDLLNAYGALMVGAHVGEEESNQQRERAGLLRHRSVYFAKSRVCRDSFINNNIGSEYSTN